MSIELILYKPKDGQLVETNSWYCADGRDVWATILAVKLPQPFYWRILIKEPPRKEGN